MYTEKLLFINQTPLCAAKYIKGLPQAGLMRVVCPRCGAVGRLTAVEVRGVYHLRVVHEEDGRTCHLGMDADGLARELERVLGPGAANAKIVQIPGGDYHIADLLLPRLERLCTRPKCTLVEVFGGSGYVSQTASRRVFGNIVYNDINNMLTTLYRHVKEDPELFAALLALLPYSRAYYRIAAELLKTCREFGSLVAAALAFYVYNTSFMGKVGKGFAYSVAPTKNEARELKTRAWAVLKYAEAWRDVVIENLDFREVIRKYDSGRTVFYLDPPYVGRSEDYYGVKFTVDDLRDLAAMLTEIRGRFLLKLDYEMYKLIKDILPEGMYRVEVVERTRHMKKVKEGRRDRWLLTLVSNPP
jgi:DNA adenine methylase